MQWGDRAFRTLFEQPRVLWRGSCFVIPCCFSMCRSSKRNLMNEGLDNTVAAIAADNIKADGGGRVIDGKYFPTKEEVLRHKQVRIRFLTKILDLISFL
jgi:hypothetical protein